MAVEVTLQGAVEDRKETIERGVTFQVDSDFFYVLDDEAEADRRVPQERREGSPGHLAPRVLHFPYVALPADAARWSADDNRAR